MAFCASTVYNWPFFLSSLLELSGHKPIDDDSLVKEMKMENKNLAKKLYSWGSHLPPKLSNDRSANFVSTFFFSSSKLFLKMISADLSHNDRKRWWKNTWTVKVIKNKSNYQIKQKCFIFPCAIENPVWRCVSRYYKGELRLNKEKMGKWFSTFKDILIQL